MDRVEGQPADGPRDGQPRLVAPVRPGDRADAGQLRGRRPAAEQPGAARPPGRHVHGRRVVGQEADPPAGAQPAYQLASTFDPKKFEADPDNALVWRMPPRRLEAEACATRCWPSRAARPDAAGGLGRGPDMARARRAARGSAGRRSPAINDRGTRTGRLPADRPRAVAGGAGAVRLPRPERGRRRAGRRRRSRPRRCTCSTPVRDPAGRGRRRPAAGVERLDGGQGDAGLPRRSSPARRRRRRRRRRWTSCTTTAERDGRVGVGGFCQALSRRRSFGTVIWSSAGHRPGVTTGGDDPCSSRSPAARP